MLKTSLKLGFAVLIAASTMLAPKVSAAAGALCVFSYTLPNGHTCTYNGLGANGCCQYTGDPHCHQICA
ncbi:MAG TPA: hypothetical protein VGH73_22760 [Thermoanaerobaculia bacterium]|jgi:hypothetical protein